MQTYREYVQAVLQTALRVRQSPVWVWPQTVHGIAGIIRPC